MINDYIELIRIRQWYKNLLVFLAIFFSGYLFNFTKIYVVILAFSSLSFVSSVGYIINDLNDLERDKLHPEKKSRALASGKISRFKTILTGFILLVAGFIIAYNLNWQFFFLLSLFLVLELAYTFLLKGVLFADVITISLLFVTRAIGGAIAINVFISPWLILCPFFLALFLALGKRHSDLLLLKEKAESTRKVLAIKLPTISIFSFPG